MNTFRVNVQKLMERMKYVAGKGRHISSDSIIQVWNKVFSTHRKTNSQAHSECFQIF